MFVFYRYFLFIFALMKLNHSKLLKGVFTEIVGSLEHQSDIVSFANRHRARLAELNNKKNDKFKLLGIGRVKQIKEYEEILGLYDTITNNKAVLSILNTLAEIENKLIKSSALLGLEDNFKISKNKQTIGGVTKIRIVASAPFKVENTINQVIRSYIGIINDKGQIEGHDGKIYKNFQEMEPVYIKVIAEEMMRRISEQESVEEVKESIKGLTIKIK